MRVIKSYRRLVGMEGLPGRLKPLISSQLSSQLHDHFDRWDSFE